MEHLPDQSYVSEWKNFLIVNVLCSDSKLNDEIHGSPDETENISVVI